MRGAFVNSFMLLSLIFKTVTSARVESAHVPPVRDPRLHFLRLLLVITEKYIRLIEIAKRYET